MAFQGINVPFKLTPEDMGSVDFGRALAQGLERYGKGSEALNKPHQLAQNLLASKLQNQINSAKAQYAPEMALAELQGKQGEVGMQPLRKKLLEAQTGLASSRMQQALAEFKKQQQMQQLISGAMNNDQYKNDNQQNNEQISQYQFGQGPMRPEGLREKILYGQENPNLQITNPGNKNQYHIDEIYEKNPQLRSEFEKQGFKKKQSVKSDPSSGQTFIQTTYPSGKTIIEAIKVGEQPKDIARNKEQGKIAGQIYGDAIKGSNSLEAQNASLDQLISNITENPIAKNVIGPVQNRVVQWAGSPEERNLLGQIMSGSGNIMLSVADNVKGAWSGKDMAMVNGIKPNVNDTFDVFVGKLKSYRALNELTKQRTDLIAELIDKGIAPHEAAKIARDKISFEPIKKQYEEVLKNSSSKNKISSTNTFNSREEALSHLDKLSPQEKMKILYSMGGGDY